MLSHGQRITGAGIRGVLPEEERRATGLAEHVTQGRLADLQAGEYRIVLGAALARELSAKVGDAVTLDYYYWEPSGSLTTRSAAFQLAGMLPMKGIAVELGLEGSGAKA